MKRAILATQRLESQFEIDCLKIKHRIMDRLFGVSHNVDIDELKNGGWVATVWVDDEMVMSGKYADLMLNSLIDGKLVDALEEYDREVIDLEKANRADASLNSAAGQAAADMVNKFFKL